MCLKHLLIALSKFLNYFQENKKEGARSHNTQLKIRIVSFDRTPAVNNVNSEGLSKSKLFLVSISSNFNTCLNQLAVLKHKHPPFKNINSKNIPLFKT